MIDQATGTAYVLAKDFISNIELGKSSLQLSDPRGFDAAKMETVVVAGAGETAGKTKTVSRVTTGVESAKVKTWGDAATGKADATLANFIDNTNNLRPTDYAPNLAIASLTPVMKLTFKDAAGAALGTLALYKGEKPGELPEGTELDPAAPPKGETAYYIVTEKTRVPAQVRADTAQRAEQDLPVVFGDRPAPATPPGPPPGMTSPVGPVPGLPPAHGQPPGSPLSPH